MQTIDSAVGATPVAMNQELFAIASTLNDSTPAEEMSPEDILALITETLEDDKAEELMTIPLAGKSDIADYMVIATGRSSTHVKAMADHVSINLKKVKMPALSSAGAAQGDWVAIDAIDVIVHLFRPEVRAFYQLEKMWAGDFSATADVKMVAVS